MDIEATHSKSTCQDCIGMLQQTGMCYCDCVRNVEGIERPKVYLVYNNTKHFIYGCFSNEVKAKLFIADTSKEIIVIPLNVC